MLAILSDRNRIMQKKDLEETNAQNDRLKGIPNISSEPTYKNQYNNQHLDKTNILENYENLRGEKL